MFFRQSVNVPHSPQNLTDEELEVISEQLTLWKNLRHDLERARMLVELVRKREKLKREQLRYLYMINDLQLRPLAMVMKRILDRLGRKDPADIFGEPVSLEEVRIVWSAEIFEDRTRLCCGVLLFLFCG